jgi:hypothetical protein
MAEISASILQVLQVQEAYRGWAPRHQQVEKWGEAPVKKKEDNRNTFAIRFKKNKSTQIYRGDGRIICQ